MVLAFAGCGGGTSGGGGSAPPPPPPPPPTGDFSLNIDSGTLTVQQQGVAQIQNIYVTPLDGFAGTVNVTMTGVPPGIAVTPSGPYNVSMTGPTLDAAIQFSASDAATPTSSTITVTGTSGSITRTGTFTLVVSPVAPFSIQVNPVSLSLTPGALGKVQISVTAAGGASPSLFASVSNPPNNSGVVVDGPEALLSPTNPLNFSVAVSALAQSLQNFPLQLRRTTQETQAR